ncbi:TPA: hypothetical protein ACK3JH_002064 [Mannheimia haemolytica]
MTYNPSETSLVIDDAHIAKTEFSEMPELITYKFRANYDKKLAEMQIPTKLNSIIAQMKSIEGIKGLVKGGFNRIRNNQSDEIEVTYLESAFDSFWFIDVERHLKYECDETYSCEVFNHHSKNVRLLSNGNAFSSCEVKNGKIQFEVTEHCETTKNYRHYLSNGSGHIDDNLATVYLGKNKFPHTKINKNNVNTDKVLKFKLSPERLITDSVLHLLREKIKAERITRDHLSFKEAKLYLVPIHFFSYSNPLKGVFNSLVKFNAVTGDCEMMNQTKYPTLISKEDLPTIISELVVETANYMLPLSGTITKLVIDNARKHQTHYDEK